MGEIWLRITTFLGSIFWSFYYTFVGKLLHLREGVTTFVGVMEYTLSHTITLTPRLQKLNVWMEKGPKSNTWRLKNGSYFLFIWQSNQYEGFALESSWKCRHGWETEGASHRGGGGGGGGGGGVVPRPTSKSGSMELPIEGQNIGSKELRMYSASVLRTANYRFGVFGADLFVWACVHAFLHDCV